MQYLLAAFGFCLCASASAAETAQIAWSDMVDASAQVFEDPYLDLTPDQLRDLVEVARLREQISSGDASASSRLAAHEDALAEAGIDADWLISQRWVIAERRQRAASAGNVELDGANVAIAGFAIPAPRDTDGTPVAYLVEQRGMCSHMPPPMPNQMIRVRLTSDWAPEYMHQPVRLTGSLHIDPSERVFRVVDGDVEMNATWRFDAREVEAYLPEPDPAGGNPAWAEQLRAKLAPERSATSD